MKTETTISGYAAIHQVEEYGGQLHAYADPTEGARDVTPDEAREIARQDPSLIWTAQTIIEAMEGGTPGGVYSIVYYRISGRHMDRDAAGDCNTSLAAVDRAISRLRPDEALVATCESTPRAGLRAYGSERARDAMRRRMAPVPADADDES
jgi:ribosomal protein L34E